MVIFRISAHSMVEILRQFFLENEKKKMLPEEVNCKIVLFRVVVIFAKEKYSTKLS